MLVDVLVSMDVLELKAKDAWRRVILVRNMSPVPNPVGSVPWGFKFMVLDASGKPAWFGRCGWASVERMQVECELLSRLGADPVTSQHVPEARFTFVNGDAVQISRHLGNAAYNLKMKGRSPERWVTDVAEILYTSEKVLSRVQMISEAGSSEIQSIARHDQVLQDCDVLRRNAVTESSVALIQHLLLEAQDELPYTLQHGDLWPANVLRARDRWWLIDFSECGLVWTPGYDLMMLLANSPGGFSTQWIGGASGPQVDRWDEARCSILREFAQRHGWSSHHLGLMVLFFLLRLTAYRMRPGVAVELAEYWRNELLRVGSILEAGGTLAHLVPLET